jgi:hypothetical protein
LKPEPPSRRQPQFLIGIGVLFCNRLALHLDGDEGVDDVRVEVPAALFACSAMPAALRAVQGIYCRLLVWHC